MSVEPLLGLIRGQIKFLRRQLEVLERAEKLAMGLERRLPDLEKLDAPYASEDPPEVVDHDELRELARTDRPGAVYAYLTGHEGCRSGDIMRDLDLSRGKVKMATDALIEERKVVMEGERGAARYYTMASRDQIAAETKKLRGHEIVDLKRRIGEAVERDPGMLRQNNLAQVLDEDEEHVAMALGELMDEQRLQINADGTYVQEVGVA